MITDNLRSQFATVQKAYVVESVAVAFLADKLLKSVRVTNGTINEKLRRLEMKNIKLVFCH